MTATPLEPTRPPADWTPADFTLGPATPPTADQYRDLKATGANAPVDPALDRSDD